MNQFLAISGSRVAAAVNEIDILLERSVEYYPADLPAYHPARLAGGPLAPYRAARMFSNPQDAYGQLNPLEQALEICRCHAEALLVHERLDQIVLGLKERQALTQRAIGILPTSEAVRLEEIFCCEPLRPRHIAQSALDLARAVALIDQDLGLGTALTYGLFVLAGLRAKQEFSDYGRKLDNLFDQIVSVPSVIQALDQVTTHQSGPRFEPLFRLLLVVRERLWQLKPNRFGGDTLLLPRVLDAYLSNRQTCGNALGLAMLDTVIIGKLGFRVRHLVEAGIPRLEVIIEGRSVYWESTEPAPLSFVPLATGGKLELPELLALNYSVLGSAYLSRGLWDKALENYHRALELSPGTAEIYTNIGVCYLRKTMPTAALKAVQQALQLVPESAEAHHLLGNIYSLMKQWPRAIDAYRKALQKRPDWTEALYNLGLAFQNAGQPNQARAAFQAVLEFRPTYTQAYLALGNLSLELKQFDEAVRCYREAARIEPGLVSAYYNLGHAYYQQGRLDDAIHSYQRAVELDPKHAAAWHNLGIAYRDKGQTDKAVAALEKAITLNPNLMR